jgi:hypothetical protein
LSWDFVAKASSVLTGDGNGSAQFFEANPIPFSGPVA